MLLEVVHVEGQEVAVQHDQRLLVRSRFHLSDEVVFWEEQSTGHHVRVLQFSLFFEYDAGQPALAFVPEQLLAVFRRERCVRAREAALSVSSEYG